MGPVHAFSEMGGAMQDASQRTGMSVEALSELGFAAEQSGTIWQRSKVAFARCRKRLVKLLQDRKRQPARSMASGSR